MPAPAVDVVLLRLRHRQQPLIAPGDSELFGDLATFAFTAWQPTVAEALGRVLRKRKVADIARASGVSLDCPPSALPFTAWIPLTAAFRTVAGAQVSDVRGARERLERQQAGLEKVHRTRAPRTAARAGNR